MHDEQETREDSNEGSSHEERIGSYIPKWPHRSDQLRELKNLRKQVNDLEIEFRGRNHKRDWEDSSDNPDNVVDGSS